MRFATCATDFFIFFLVPFLLDVDRRLNPKNLCTLRNCELKATKISRGKRCCCALILLHSTFLCVLEQLKERINFLCLPTTFFEVHLSVLLTITVHFAGHSSSNSSTLSIR